MHQSVGASERGRESETAGDRPAGASEYRRELDLSSTKSGAAAQTRGADERLERLRQGHADPQLVAQYFQYGRYLLIGSSRPGSRTPAL